MGLEYFIFNKKAINLFSIVCSSPWASGRCVGQNKEANWKDYNTYKVNGIGKRYRVEAGVRTFDSFDNLRTFKTKPLSSLTSHPT